MSIRLRFKKFGNVKPNMQNNINEVRVKKTKFWETGLKENLS